MGVDLYNKYPSARDTYNRAVDILKMDIRQISFEGPLEKLRQTRFTQPAILTHSLTVLSVLPEVEPVLVAGHSLGEYAALYAARALDFESVLKIVKKRAEMMDNEGKKSPGTMAAIIGLQRSVVENLCQEVEGIVVPANYNEPKQTVVSGDVTAVKKVAELAKEKGAFKVIMLSVSGAFHSPLLEESSLEFTDYLDRFEIHEPCCPVIPNFTGKPTTDTEVIRSALARQLTNPVRWVKTMASAQELGCTEFLEIGPGRVLKGLARRIDRELKVTTVGTVDQITELID